jgi:hypothetical protein
MGRREEYRIRKKREEKGLREEEEEEKNGKKIKEPMKGSEKKGDIGSKLRRKEGSQYMRMLGKEKARRKKKRI